VVVAVAGAARVVVVAVVADPVVAELVLAVVAVVADLVGPSGT